MNKSYTYQGDPLVNDRNDYSLCCTPETKIIWYVNYKWKVKTKLKLTLFVANRTPVFSIIGKTQQIQYISAFHPAIFSSTWEQICLSRCTLNLNFCWVAISPDQWSAIFHCLEKNCIHSVNPKFIKMYPHKISKAMTY